MSSATVRVRWAPRLMRTAAAKRAREALGRLNRRLDYPHAPRHYARPEEVWFASIYRARNSAIIERILATRDDRWEVHLWALDGVTQALGDVTRGTGKGWKFELLQRLLDDFPPSPSAWVILSDDDYRFRRGSLGDLLALAQTANLDLAQPAHRRFVNASHDFNLVRPRVIARRTHFVEIGPLVVMSPTGQAELLPFPPAEMGWGVEAPWGVASQEGRIVAGIVDAVTIEHLGRVAGDYDRSAAFAELDRFVDEAGLTSLRDLQVNVGWWRRLRKPPQWRTGDR
jgi:hypothetical protein